MSRLSDELIERLAKQKAPHAYPVKLFAKALGWVLFVSLWWSGSVMILHFTKVLGAALDLAAYRYVVGGAPR